MEEAQRDQIQQPAASRRRDRIRALLTSSTSTARRRTHDLDHSQSNHSQTPSLFRRLTTSRRSGRPSTYLDPVEGPSEDGETAAASASRRGGRRFSVRNRSPNPRFSYIHQETVTTISDRREQELSNGDDGYAAHEQDDDTLEVGESRSQNRRRRLSVQMSNFFNNVTSPRNRAGIVFPPNFCAFQLEEQPFSPTTYDTASNRHSTTAPGRSFTLQSLPHRPDIYDLPPPPAEVRVGTSHDDLGDANDSEYERGYTPRRRLRPQPLVGEPHDEDYVRRREELRARRATWGPAVAERFHRSADSDSSSPYRRRSQARLSVGGQMSPESSTSALSIPRTASSRPPRPRSGISLLNRSIASSTSSPPDAVEVQTPTTAPAPAERRSLGPSLFRQALSLGLRNRSNWSRRNSNLTDNWGDEDGTSDGRIPLAQLQQLLQSYASQRGDADYDGHQETTVDGGTITIYGIRRVNPRSNPDMEDDDMFPPFNAQESRAEARREDRPRRARRPRRIFNFIGVDSLEPIPRDLEETFERLRRTRRPRSMFGSGSLRRNGVVEPDVTQPSNDSTSPRSEDTNSTADSDETWIFYIVSAVLPEGHPLLSAPSLFTDNPTYEDMLFLDNFLQKPVANRTDLAAARGLYRIHRRSNGDLYAQGQEEVDDVIPVEAEKCLICLSEFEVDEEMRRLMKCEHLFHRECIDHWLTEGRNSCPLCRGEGVEKKNRSSRHTVAGPSSSSGARSNSPNLL